MSCDSGGLLFVLFGTMVELFVPTSLGYADKRLSRTELPLPVVAGGLAGVTPALLAVVVNQTVVCS